ncbi:hypothetical protein [Streptomyces sp. RTGN2]|uniref:hypothetical protein n=1 Tax=Streptomyces sp. RTGN2 TaxID=3016525 RepID=UPI0025559F28|nr:hypothetical protein [Streptomyces sp. RTGN2]
MHQGGRRGEPTARRYIQRGHLAVFRSHEAKDAYENSPLADELRDEIIGLLAEPTLRIEVHPYSALPADPA